jgi:hypothetical protein
MAGFGSAHSTLRLVLLIALVLTVGLFASCSSDDTDESFAQPTATPETSHVSVQLEQGIERKEVLVKEVDDIYIGKVESVDRTYSRYDRGDVWTQYTVSVEQALLGELRGNVTVIQQGGFDPAENVLVIAEGDPLLEVGTTYLFASRTGRNNLPEEEGQHFIVPVYGDIQIEDEDHRQRLIQEFTEAIEVARPGS